MSTKKRTSNNPAGRPRSDDATNGIFDAIFTILETNSYEDLSMDGIAVQAGVSRPTLYRRFSNIGQVTLAALQEKGSIILQMPHTGRIEKDLYSYFYTLVASVSEGSSVGRALRGALAAALVDVDLKPHFAQFIAARRKPVLDRLLVWNGSYISVQYETIADALFGPIFYRLLIRQVPVRNMDIRRIVHRALEVPA